MQELADIKELKKKQYLMYIVIMLVLFVVMLAYTVVWCFDYNKRYGFFVKTEAVVVEHVTESGKLYDVLEYDVDGVVLLNKTSYISQNNIGDKITIYYDENNPSGFVTKLDGRRIALPIITSIYGVASMVLTIMFYTSFYMENGAMHSSEKTSEEAEKPNKTTEKKKSSKTTISNGNKAKKKDSK